MAKAKGSPKTGGRAKGTPNKSTQLGKECIIQMLSDYRESGLMSSDFMAIEPKDRLIIAEKLMQYYMPKMQATTVDLTANERQATIIDRLADLAGEEE